MPAITRQICAATLPRAADIYLPPWTVKSPVYAQAI
jgi:hypothetical protein